VLPFVLMVVGVENTFQITKAVVSTSIDLPVKERIGLGMLTSSSISAFLPPTPRIITSVVGLGQAGHQMTITLLAEFFVMFIGSLTSVPTLQEFCTFATFAVLYNYLLHLTFFTTILSIDVRRLELTDLHDHRVVRVMRTSSEESPFQKQGTSSIRGKGLGCLIVTPPPFRPKWPPSPLISSSLCFFRWF